MGNTLKHTKNEIAVGFQKNNEAILRKVYLSVYPKVRTHILKNNGDEEQSKDIFQEAFIACWKNVKKNNFNGDQNIEGYLFTIAKNKWTDYLRSAHFKKTISENGVLNLQSTTKGAIDEGKDEKKRNALNKAFQQLGDGCKEILTQFYFERKSMDEIAAATQMGSASVRNKKYRCMEKLRNLSLQIKNNG